MSKEIEEYYNNSRQGAKELGVSQGGQNDIGGSLVKRFVRVPSDMLTELWQEKISNPNCSYVTHVDGLIEEVGFKGGLPPISHVSALLKLDRYDGEQQSCENIYREVCATRIANLFGVPVNYARHYQDENGDNYTMLVDFLSKDCEILTLAELDSWEELISLNYYDPSLEKRLECMDKLFRSAKAQKLGITEEDISRLKRDFVRNHLVRSCILQDIDDGCSNTAIIYNTSTGRVELAPLFDLEFCFKYVNTSMSTFWGRVDEDIAYCAKFYPEELGDFIIKYRQVKDGNMVEKIISENLLEQSKVAGFIREVFSNIEVFEDIYRGRKILLFRRNYNDKQRITII